MARPIIVNKDHENFIRSLSGIADRKDDTSIDNDETRIFTNRYDLVRFAAALGYTMGKKDKMEKDTFVVMEPRIVDAQKKLKDDINIIAVADNGNEEIFDCEENVKEKNEEKRFNIYYEYLNGGLAILKQWYNTDIVGYNGIIKNLVSNGIIQKEKKKLEVSQAKPKRKKKIIVKK